jgi:hypothetical protein
MHASTDTRADLLRALGVFAEPPGPQHRRLAELVGLPVPTGSEWTEAFTVQLSPHAAIYLGPEGMLGGEAAHRVAGFWRALHLPVPADPDHLTALLGLYAALIEAQAGEPVGPRRVLLGQARAALLHEHLLSWLLGYTYAMSDVAPPPYAAWADLLGRAIRGEAREVGAPDRLPAHLRAAPSPASNDDSLDTVLAHLLCPARSGLILARGHLAALARDAGLGLRLGDRRRMLRSLLDQDPRTALGLLADRAQQWAGRHRTDEPTAGSIATHWATRATTTAEMVRDVADTRPHGVSAVEDRR